MPVSVESPEIAVRDFKDAIVRLANNPDLWQRLSTAAVQRTAFFSWERLSEEIDIAYQSALSPEPFSVDNWQDTVVESKSNRAAMSPSRLVAALHQSME
jgi:hypothetical protein